ncbi:hypothetical protein D3C84_1092390 [compost metagenome]
MHWDIWRSITKKYRRVGYVDPDSAPAVISGHADRTARAAEHHIHYYFIRCTRGSELCLHAGYGQ